MNSRVSIRLPPTEKVFTATEPIGRSQSWSALIVIVISSGIASQRSLSAPSDHSGETTSYGISPAAGLAGFFGSTQPVSESSCGKPSGGGGALGTSLEISPLISTV